MNDMSKAPAFFHFDNKDEVIETRYLGKLTLHDVGYERVEAILFDEGRRTDASDEAQKTMMERVIKRLVLETVRGEHGERITNEAKLPGRLMMDMIKIRKAVVRMYGLDSEDVKNE